MAARREKPEDDLLSVLVEAELQEADGVVHRLSDPEIYSFAILLLIAMLRRFPLNYRDLRAAGADSSQPRKG